MGRARQRRGPADIVELAVRHVGSGVGDHVKDVAGGVAEFRREAVGDGLHFAHIDVGDGEQAQAVAVGLGVHHAVHLVVDAVQQAVHVERARDAQFRIGVAAHAGLKDDEVVRIARGQRQVVDLRRG